MKELSSFELPLHRLTDGFHHYEYEIDDSFFDELEQDLIDKGHFVVKVDLEKNSEIIVLNIQHKGYLEAECDRCLESIKLPIEDNGRIVIKFVEEIRMDDEVTYLLKGTEKLDLAPFVFEVISLSLPLVNTFDCAADELAPCNEKVLEILARRDVSTSPADSPIWDELKKLNLKS